MDNPKYSHVENERRFLVESLNDVDLDHQRYVQIEDRYIAGTRMRLRSVTTEAGNAAYKLCKKYPTNDSYSGAMVNTYLSQHEYRLFSALPGKILTKKRYSVHSAGEPYGVNVFEQQLSGLVLCEAEKPTRPEVCSLAFPLWATKEVTEDDFFTGGHLCQVTAEQLQAKLSAMDV